MLKIVLVFLTLFLCSLKERLEIFYSKKALSKLENPSALMFRRAGSSGANLDLNQKVRGSKIVKV